MSRIGKLPVNLPKGVTVSVSDDNVVSVKGPLGELTQSVDTDLKIEIVDNQIILNRPSESKNHKSLHGLYRALLANMVAGVSQGYKKELELVGVVADLHAAGAKFVDVAPLDAAVVTAAFEPHAVGGHLPPEFDPRRRHYLTPGLDLPVYGGERGHQPPVFDVEVADLSVPAAGRIVQASPGNFKAHGASSNPLG